MVGPATVDASKRRVERNQMRAMIRICRREVTLDAELPQPGSVL